MSQTLTAAEFPMLKHLIWIMPILWLVGILTSFTVGGLIHILPVVSLILFFWRFSGEENTRPGDKAPRIKSSKPPKRNI